jgi:hypothetical protein
VVLVHLYNKLTETWSGFTPQLGRAILLCVGDGMNKQIFYILMFAVGAIQNPHNVIAQEWQIHHLGILRHEDCRINPKLDWFGLAYKEGQLELLSGKVQVEIVSDPSIAPVGEKTGQLVKFTASENVLWLLRGPGLKPGPVETRISSPVEIAPGESVEIATRLNLKASTEYCIWIESKTKSQKLWCHPNIDRGGGWPQILWSGDLDRDHKVDFILDSAVHYSHSKIEIYLSSKARADDIVGLVASSIQHGC